MEATFKQTISTSNTLTTGFSASAEFSIEEGIEGIAKATESFKISASVSTSDTTTHSDEKDMSVTDH